MSRPRFHRLPAEQQTAILDAALQEFAGHGFDGASLNRIIETTGTSKGAMYYYFDGKEDLYADVIRRQLERLFDDSGPIPVPAVSDPDSFWATMEEHYLGLMRLLIATPETATLLRNWLTGTGAPALHAAQQEAGQDILPWLIDAVTAGQQIGAVRTDLPTDLLIAVAMGMGQAMDIWLITQPDEGTDLAESVHALMDLMRRALAP